MASNQNEKKVVAWRCLDKEEDLVVKLWQGVRASAHVRSLAHSRTHTHTLILTVSYSYSVSYCTFLNTQLDSGTSRRLVHPLICRTYLFEDTPEHMRTNGYVCRFYAAPTCTLASLLLWRWCAKKADERCGPCFVQEVPFWRVCLQGRFRRVHWHGLVKSRPVDTPLGLEWSKHNLHHVFGCSTLEVRFYRIVVWRPSQPSARLWD